jgi:hypothetical protein
MTRRFCDPIKHSWNSGITPHSCIYANDCAVDPSIKHAPLAPCKVRPDGILTSSILGTAFRYVAVPILTSISKSGVRGRSCHTGAQVDAQRNSLIPPVPAGRSISTRFIARLRWLCRAGQRPITTFAVGSSTGHRLHIGFAR